MSLIEKLIEIRFYNFIREFDIIITDFDTYSQINKRKNSWDILKQKLIKSGYATNEYDIIDCYLLIINMLLKNIITNEIIDDHDKWHTFMPYNGYSTITLALPSFTPYLSYKAVLGKSNIKYNPYYPEHWENCTILQTKIINYIMLLDILVTENMIYDLAHILKAYIFDVILVL